MKPTDEEKRPVPFNRSYWVIPGKILAGCYPGAVDPAVAHQKLKGLLDHGVRRVINLMERGEINWELRKNTEDRDKSSPESPQQVEMVLSWIQGE